MVSPHPLPYLQPWLMTSLWDAFSMGRPGHHIFLVFIVVFALLLLHCPSFPFPHVPSLVSPRDLLVSLLMYKHWFPELLQTHRLKHYTDGYAFQSFVSPRRFFLCSPYSSSANLLNITTFVPNRHHKTKISKHCTCSFPLQLFSSKSFLFYCCCFGPSSFLSFTFVFSHSFQIHQ